MELREGMRFNQYQYSEESWLTKNERSQFVCHVDISFTEDGGRNIAKRLDSFGIKGIGVWVVKKVKEAA